MVDVSICVLSYKAKDVLDTCLTSIYQYCQDVSFELIVVDNASNDGTVEMIREKYPNARVVTNEENLFFKGYDQALGLSMGRYFLIMSQDVAFVDSSLSKLVSFMDASPEVGLVAPRGLYRDRHVEPIPRRDYTFCGLLLSYTLVGLWLPTRRERWARFMFYDREFDSPREVEIVQDSCALVRREAVAEGCLYDPNLRLYFTENDLCNQMRKRGWQVYYLPSAVVQHVGSYSARRESPVRIQWLYHQDLFYYSERYFGKLRTTFIVKPLDYLTLAWRFVKAVLRGHRRDD